MQIPSHTELDRVKAQLRENRAFAEVTVQREGENLKGWYTLTEEETREAVREAKSVLARHAAREKQALSPPPAPAPAPKATKLSGPATAEDLIRHYQAGQRDFRGILLRPGPTGKIRLDHANLKGVDLRGVSLYGASMVEADLSDADLSGANLSHAVLVRANFRGATLRNANFYQADVRDAGFADADLTGADFSNARDVPYFGDAILDGANLSGMSLYPNVWQRAKSVRGLILPDGRQLRGPA